MFTGFYARPRIKIYKFLWKKIEILHELGYGNHVGRMFCTTRPSASDQGATEY